MGASAYMRRGPMSDSPISSTTTVVDGLPVQALPTSWPVVDSRSVAAEWRDGLLDADGDTKRLSRLEADGQYSQSAAPYHFRSATQDTEAHHD
jgi:hypothetical protein